MRNYLIILFSLCIFSANAAENSTEISNKSWGFSGPFGKFDKSRLQRGLQVYKEVCATCHSLKYIAYRNLSDLGYEKEEIKAFAQEFMVLDGPNDSGEMFERPAKPSDYFVSPYSNVNAAKSANGGAYPPDLSLMTKARAGGANYLYSLLTGYKDAPIGFDVKDGLYYNVSYPGSLIAMPQPLYENSVDYLDGTESSIENMAADVTEFLSWAAEPEMESRKRIGLATISFLLVMVILSYFAKLRIWSNLKRK